MNIFKAMQICGDIKRLYQNKGEDDFASWNYSNWYQIRTPNDGKILESHHREKSLSPSEFVPVNFWTTLIGTEGNHATIPQEFTVTFNNNGMLPHAPMEKDYVIHGIAARLIYNRIKKEHLADWHKTLKQQREKRK